MDSPKLYLTQHAVDALYKNFRESGKELLLGEGYWERWLAENVVVVEPIEWGGPHYGRWYRTANWFRNWIVRPIKWNRWRKRKRIIC